MIMSHEYYIYIFFMYYITMCKLTIYSVSITFLVPIREMSFK